MANSYVAGALDFGALQANEYPQGWREMVLRIAPAGRAPVTAFSSMMKSEKLTTGPDFNWWEQEYPDQTATVTGIADDFSGTTYTVAADAKGFTHYWQCSEEDTKQFRPGMLVLAKETGTNEFDMRARVINVAPNGSNSYIVTISQEVAPLSGAEGLDQVDVLYAIGNAEPDMGTRPEAIVIRPQQYSNKAQIFRDSAAIPRTVMQTMNFRTGSAYEQNKINTLLLHATNIEKGIIWGIKDEWIDANGQPNRTTEGVASSIKDRGINKDFREDETGSTWISKGLDWIEDSLEEIFRYNHPNGGPTRLGLCGSGAIKGINRVVRDAGHMNISPGVDMWGTRVKTWTTYYGDIDFITHPLMTQSAATRNTMILFEPVALTFYHIQDTMFKPDNLWDQGGSTGVDGKQEEWLTHGGLKYEYASTGSILEGIGLDG